ncbi:MAG: type I restriction enzyme HsdR N-terminal domain-containing protein [Promicromonosporaceae bacterium]|nr:type I restriction enzyme HsdR N-terminal domain-containing protein [Promicromonosporaceae bacterium]
MQKGGILTEEATKNAFVMPFLNNVLGYDVFDPDEVVPEFIADVGLKRGEKVDYAIKHGGSVQILIEVKKSSVPLDLEHASQLYRYFAVTNARIAILTNGQVYKFYTDLDQPNRMDSKPFLVLDLLEVDEVAVPELAKLTRSNFDLDSVIGAAEELKYVGQIKREIAAQFKEPTDDWVKFFTGRVYEGSFTQRVREQFKPLVVKAATQFLNDQASSRLKSALGDSSISAVAPSPVPSDVAAVEEPLDTDADLPVIVTTDEELEAFAVVKAIACAVVKPARIVSRDAKSYFAILLDDNNRKSIARLHFNGKNQKYLGVFNVDGIETKFPVRSADEIYDHADRIRARVEALAG